MIQISLLRSWDTRLPTIDKKSTKSAKPKPLTPSFTSPFDPTSLGGSRRPRGLTSFTLGTGPTTGLLFALGADSRVHTYAVPGLIPQTQGYAHENMQTNSFYVRVAVSPCGNWLASGSNGTGSVFLYDVSNALRPSKMTPTHASAGVELRGQKGEVGAVDWAEGMLATCADDGSVRVWRPDVDVYRGCIEEPEESKWNWAWSLGE
jgi:denticleless